MATKEVEVGGGMDLVDEQRSKCLGGIVHTIARACANENWGLVVEAAEDYLRFVLGSHR